MSMRVKIRQTSASTDTKKSTLETESELCSPVNPSMPGLSPGWTMVQEMELLEAVERTGPSCWEEVATIFRKKGSMPRCTAAQLEEHFSLVYVEGKCNDPQLSRNSFNSLLKSKFLSSTLPSAPASSFPSTYFPHVAPSHLPPRPSLGVPTTSTMKYMAGYNPARADYFVPPDPGAEDLLTVITEAPQSQLEMELQLALVQGYNSRMEERHRKYRIVREHGLMLRQSRNKAGKVRKEDRNRFRWARYGQVVCYTDLVWILEGIQLEQQLRERITELQGAIVTARERKHTKEKEASRHWGT